MGREVKTFSLSPEVCKLLETISREVRLSRSRVAEEALLRGLPSIGKDKMFGAADCIYSAGCSLDELSELSDDMEGCLAAVQSIKAATTSAERILLNNMRAQKHED